MRSDVDAVKDLLLEDYRYRAESFRRNEELGETRVNIFVGFAGALLTLLGFTIKELGIKDGRLYAMVLGVLFVLLVLGFLTLLRLINRNAATDECKRDLDAIRQTFKDYAVRDGVLFGYSPFGYALGTIQSRRFGGLSHLMAAVNGLLFAGFIGAAVLLAADQDFTRGAMITAIAIAAEAFVGSCVLQRWYIDRCSSEADLRLRGKRVTHAGGVVYRMQDGVAHYVIIRPKANLQPEWVLPKGHVDYPEDHVDAAAREVYEETGVVARPICFLGFMTFTVGADCLRAKFYLMEMLFQDRTLSAVVKEHRMPTWLPFEAAFERLTHAESKNVLRWAEEKRRQGSPP
jgi:8-oxo-dGTP pyrophosphatase MutT (NUDIX family)